MINTSKENNKLDVFEDYFKYHQIKLEAPVSYTMEDLLMTLVVLLILLLMVLIWYSLARILIYITYHSDENRITYQKDTVEDDIDEGNFLKQEHGVKL